MRDVHHFDIFADYHQIYLQDVSSEIAPAQVEQIDARVAQLLDKEALASHMGVAHGAVCLLTARNLTVPVDVEIGDAAPSLDDISDWDHIVEGSLQVPSGCIRIHGPTDYLPAAPQIQIEPGTYRVRAYSGGVHTLSADRLEGKDYYRVVLWPAHFAEVVVIHATGDW